MKRRRFTFMRILCLLVCIGTAVVWVRSYRTNDDLFLIYKSEGSERISTLNGQFMFEHERPESGTYGGFQRITHRSDRVSALPPRPWRDELLQTRWGIFRYFNITPPSPATLQLGRQRYAQMRALQQKRALTPVEMQTLMNLQSAVYRQQAAMNPRTSWEVVFPLWLIPTALVFPLLLFWAIGTSRRVRRKRRGLCPACGYDLRASSDRCPECGAAAYVAHAA
jgi:hypothetical protein